MMQLLIVHKHAKLDQENLWAAIRDHRFVTFSKHSNFRTDIRSKTVEILDN